MNISSSLRTSKILFRNYTHQYLWLRHVATATKPVSRKPSGMKKKHVPQNNFGLDKRAEKTLRRKLLMDQEQTKSEHIFKQLYPWQSKLELASHLKETEVYNKDGLIAVCKPYGVSLTKDHLKQNEHTQTVAQMLAGGGMPDRVPTINDVLPVLQKLYNLNHLEVIKSTERWSSGILLLSSSPDITQKVNKSFRRSRAFQKPHMTYHALTVGVPRPLTAALKTAIGLEYVANTGKVPVIQKKYSKSDVVKGKIKVVSVNHSTISHNEDADISLVKLSALHSKWHFLRVWLAYTYSPVLGDHLYGSRVKAVAGKRIQVSHHNLSTYVPQSIPAKLYSLLNLPAEAAEMIPGHLHLSAVELQSFNKDKSNLIIEAALPSYFSWTCEQLGLHAKKELS